MSTSRVINLNDVEINVITLCLASPESEIRFSPFNFLLTKDKPCCSVIGPSGSGKTTFFKSLIHRFRSDWSDHSTVDIRLTVRVNGVELNKNSDSIGYAAQRPFFLPHKTVVENLRIPFRWIGSPFPTENVLNECISNFKLDSLRERRAYQLSAGERQRLNLARMFLGNPAIAVIDECLSPMDEEMAADIGNTIADKYSPFTRILVTGHRTVDLKPFMYSSGRFSYTEGNSGRTPIRNITVVTS
jgi:ABC-type multidrug transport system ATPase subunit